MSRHLAPFVRCPHGRGREKPRALRTPDFTFQLLDKSSPIRAHIFADVSRPPVPPLSGRPPAPPWIYSTPVFYCERQVGRGTYSSRLGSPSPSVPGPGAPHPGLSLVMTTEKSVGPLSIRPPKFKSGPHFLISALSPPHEGPPRGGTVCCLCHPRPGMQRGEAGACPQPSHCSMEGCFEPRGSFLNCGRCYELLPFVRNSFQIVNSLD